MRILVVTQYFWPETFGINDFCKGLQDRGHEVVILTGKPNYPTGKLFSGYTFTNKRTETWNGMKVYRSALLPRGKGNGINLFLNYFSFAFFASIRVFFIKERFDNIFVYEPSPITVGIPAIVAKFRFKSPICFWVQDLWPESLSAAGDVKNKFVLRVMDSITRFIYRQSKYVLIQSEAFRPYVLQQQIPNERIVYFPNSTDDFYKQVEPDEKYAIKLPKGFKVMFAGNIGIAQNFDTLLRVAQILKNENVPVTWAILGDGRMRSYVESKIDEYGLQKHFILLGSFPAVEMPFFFSHADALIVSLKKERIFALTIPSKIQSYLACGRPLIGSLDGEGARVIKESGAGFSADAENPQALADCIKRMYLLDPEERKKMGSNGRKYFEQEFQRERLFEKLESLMKAR